MLKERLRTLWELFLTFAKMGVITFGGGMAMLPILQREIVYTRRWATEEELLDYYAIGQCTPGVIAVNTATFIGQKMAGPAGGMAATLGMVFPSLVIISLIAGLIANFSDLAWVRNAFAGIQVCVCVLIFNATMKLLKKSVIDKRTALIFALVLSGSVVLNLSPAWFVLLSAGAGIALKEWEARHGAEEGRGEWEREAQGQEAPQSEEAEQEAPQGEEAEQEAPQSEEAEQEAPQGKESNGEQEAGSSC